MDLLIQLVTGGVGKASTTEDLSAKTSLVGRPNPFNPSTMVHFDLAEPADVVLTIYDIGGRLVHKFDRERLEAGSYDREWAGRNDQGQPVAAGVYIAKLQAGDRVITQKMVLAK